MLFEDKKSVLSRALAGGIIGLVVFIPLGGLFNDLVNGGLITMGPHTPFRLMGYDLEGRGRPAPRDRPRAAAMTASTSPPMVAVLTPPAVEPLEPPMNIKTSVIVLVASRRVPWGIE